MSHGRVPQSLRGDARGSDPDVPDPDEAALRFLIELPRVFARHAGSTLFHHLLGTFEILARWRFDSDVCHAGLFHSIYGTDANDIAPLDLARRAELRSVIGERAESLAYRFCATNWSTVWPAFGPETVRDVGLELCAIAAANLVEQTSRVRAFVPDPAALRMACEPFAALAPFLPAAASAALLHELEQLRDQSR